MKPAPRGIGGSGITTVSWAARLGAVTREGLARLKGMSPASAQSELSALAKVELLSSCRPLRHMPTLYAATSEGMSACGEQGLKPCEVTPGGVPHLIACAAVAGRLHCSCPEHRLAGERELRRDEGIDGGPLASATLGVGKDGAELLHRPDLVLWPREGGRPVAVEVELTLKTRERLAEIVEAWAGCELVAGVLYVASAKTESALRQAVQEIGAGQKIAVISLRSPFKWLG